MISNDVDWIRLSQDTNHWLALLNTVLNLHESGRFFDWLTHYQLLEDFAVWN
jgi:hypothetical protein